MRKRRDKADLHVESQARSNWAERKMRLAGQDAHQVLKHPEIFARILGSGLMSLSDLESLVRSFSSDSYHGSLIHKI